jgi:hypothetical protein
MERKVIAVATKLQAAKHKEHRVTLCTHTRLAATFPVQSSAYAKTSPFMTMRNGSLPAAVAKDRELVGWRVLCLPLSPRTR